MLNSELESLGREVVNYAYLVHKKLGPGLLEKIYESCLAHELSKAGIDFSRQLNIPIIYDGLAFGE